MRRMVFFVALITFASQLSFVFASEEEHPDKRISTKKITARLVGFQQGDYLHAVVKTDAGKEESFFIDKEQCFLALNHEETLIIQYDQIERFFPEGGGYYPANIIQSIATKTGKTKWSRTKDGKSNWGQGEGCSRALKTLTIDEPAETQTQESAGPVDTVRAFLAALSNADLDGVVATFAEDGTVFMPIPSVPKRLSGRNEIREAFAPFLEDIRASGHGPPYMVLNPQDMQVQKFDLTAIVTCHLGKLPADQAKEPTSFSRRSFVLRCVEGKWLIVHMHGSNVMVQPKGKE